MSEETSSEKFGMIRSLVVVSLMSLAASPNAFAQGASQSLSIYNQALRVYNVGQVMTARRMMAGVLSQPNAKPTAEMYCLYAETYLSDLVQSEANSPGGREAEQGLVRALKLDPECGWAYKDLAHFANVHGDYKAAIPYATKAIQAKKPDVNGFLHRSVAYSHLHELDKALADINQFIKVGHAIPLHIMLKADILLQLGRYAEALPFYHQAFKGNTGFQVLLLHKIVQCLEKQQKYKEAIIETDNWLKVDRENAQIFALRGHLKKELKEYKAAVDDYTTAVSLEPTAKYYKDRAELYNLLGNKDLAAKDLRSAEN